MHTEYRTWHTDDNDENNATITIRNHRTEGWMGIVGTGTRVVRKITKTIIDNAVVTIGFAA